MTATCLPQESLRFLADLEKHNNRAWFDANRGRCEQQLIAPVRGMVARICDEISTTFPRIVGSPAPSGGSITRLHRDVRFSTDKKPFHSHIGMHFWHEDGRKMEVPGFFLRVDPKEILLGTGLRQPDPAVVQRLRMAIDRDRTAWRAASCDKSFVRIWGGLDGESLKRVPAPWSADDPLADDFRRKDFTAFVRLPAAAVTKPGFSTVAVRSWNASKPLMSFLCTAMGLRG